MESRSPLKEWARRHSPLKNRNKPLPEPPRMEQSPLRSGSGNVNHKSSMSKLRSLLKQKEKGSKSSQSSPPRRNPDKHTASRQLDGTHRSPIRKEPRRRTSVDLSNLSYKVSALEAQLREARRELDKVAEASSSSRRHCSQPLPSDVDKAIRQKHERIVDQSRCDGLVENLLDRSQRGANRSNNKNTAKRAFSEHKASDDFYVTLDRKEGQELDDAQYRRKRSELRRASWSKIQDHMSSMQNEQCQPSVKGLDKEEEHSRARRQKQHHERQLPPAPVLPDEFSKKGQSTHARRQSRAVSAPVEQSAQTVRKGQTIRSVSEAQKFEVLKPKPYEINVVNMNYEILVHDNSADEGSESERDENDGKDDIKDFIYDEDEEERLANPGPPSPHRKLVPAPTKLRPVREEYEWDEDVF